MDIEFEETNLKVVSADFRTPGSLSEIMEAITGQSFAGLHAPIPERFRIPPNSSSDSWRVLATFDFEPWSSTSWKTRLYAYTFGSV